MTNKGINQLIISGNRMELFDFIIKSKFTYSNYEIDEINNNQFCIMFKESFATSTHSISECSEKFPNLIFKLYYADKLLSRASILVFDKGKITSKQKNLHLTLKEMQQDLLFQKAFGELL